jgi:hypothetical protein
MENYTVALALEDYLPVLLSAYGLFLIARMITRMDPQCSRLAYLGVALIALGGLSKATWKLIGALSSGQTNIQLLDNALFFCLAPGFILLTFALWYAQRSMYGGTRPRNVWIVPGALALLTVFTAAFIAVAMFDPNREGRQMWFFMLLGMTTIFNFVALGLAIRQARRQKLTLAIGLFVINLAAIIILQGLARTSNFSEPMQWVQQITNTLAQVALVYGASLLSNQTDRLLSEQVELRTSAA